jgi:hypothetical protein
MTAEQLLGRAERWRPWRAYAAQHLWAADGAIASKTNGRAKSLTSAIARRHRGGPPKIILPIENPNRSPRGI